MACRGEFAEVGLERGRESSVDGCKGWRVIDEWVNCCQSDRSQFHQRSCHSDSRNSVAPPRYCSAYWWRSALARRYSTGTGFGIRLSAISASNRIATSGSATCMWRSGSRSNRPCACETWWIFPWHSHAFPLAVYFKDCRPMGYRDDAGQFSIHVFFARAWLEINTGNMGTRHFGNIHFCNSRYCRFHYSKRNYFPRHIFPYHFL